MSQIFEKGEKYDEFECRGSCSPRGEWVFIFSRIDHNLVADGDQLLANLCPDAYLGESHSLKESSLPNFSFFLLSEPQAIYRISYEFLHL